MNFRNIVAAVLITASVSFAQTQPPLLPPSSPPATSAPVSAPSTPSPEVQALIAQLSSPDEATRTAAMEKLVGMGDEAKAALEAHLRGKEAADAALARIEANKVAGPTLVSLHLDKVKGDDAIKAMAKESGYELRPYNDQMWRQGRLGTVTINVDKQPFWKV